MAKRTTKDQKAATGRAPKPVIPNRCGYKLKLGVCEETKNLMGPHPTFHDRYHDKLWLVTPCRRHDKAIRSKRDTVFEDVGWIATDAQVEEFRGWVSARFVPKVDPNV